MLYVPGNHEHYGLSLAETRRQARRTGATAAGSPCSTATRLASKGVRFSAPRCGSDFHIAGTGEAREQAMAAAVRFSHDFSRIRIDDADDAPLTPDALRHAVRTAPALF